ncbi:hypothetical protein F66182_7083 [Fusarium sp. NRRL 66182]|nr:hypothetical protein F66182_7083 [Fusarium sp. NRRL 66182]
MASSMTGEQTQALAERLEPLSPKGLGASAAVVAVILGIISFVVVSLRVYVRWGKTKASSRVLGADDLLAVLSMGIFMPAVAFTILAVRYGVGAHDADIPSPLYLILAVKYQTIWELLYFVSSTIVKCSIGLACTRLDSRKKIIIPLHVNMLVMVVVTILALIFVFVNCQPFAATWNPALGTCQTTVTLQTVSYVVSAIQMVTDWTCAILPVFIVTNLQMNRRTKVSVIFILGLGIFASIATCVRMPYLKYYDTKKYPTEIAYHLGVISITSNIECSLGIIASSLPPLRKLFKFYYGSSDASGYNATGDAVNGLESAGAGFRLNSLNGQEEQYHVSVQGTSSSVTDLKKDDDASSST